MNDDGAVDILRRALKVVVDAGVPDYLHAAALPEIVALLRTESSSISPLTPPARENSGSSLRSTTSAGTEGSIARVASALGLATSDLEGVFSVAADGGLELVISARRLATTKGDATKELALLVVGGRQLGGWDVSWTDSERIRSVCREYGKFQSNHFAETLSELDDALAFSGRGASRKVKLLRPGVDEVRELVKRLGGKPED